MARVRVLQPLDFADDQFLDLQGFQSLSVSSSQIVIDYGGGERAVYDGSGFVSNGDTVTAGTVTAHSYFLGSQVYAITGLDLDASDIAKLYEKNNGEGLAKLLAQDDDVATGSSGNDRMFTFDGDDFIQANGGDDYIDGGKGENTAMYSGDAAGFRVTKSGKELIVDDIDPSDGDEGTDTIKNIQWLEFNGVMLAAEPTQDQPAPAEVIRPLAIEDSYVVDGVKAMKKGVKLKVTGNDEPGSAKIDKKSVQIEDQPDADEGVVTAEKGKIIFQPAEGFEGEVSFTYTVADKNGVRSDETEVILDIQLPPPPVAVGDVFDVFQSDVGKKGIKLDVLNNDTITGKLDKKASGVIDEPANGDFAVKKGAIYYKPGEGFDGRDTLTYQLVDKAGLKSAVVEVEINVVDDSASASLSIDDLLGDDAPVLPEGGSPGGESGSVSHAAMIDLPEIESLIAG